MIAWKYKHWRTLGAAAAFGMSAGLAACGGEGGEGSHGEAGGGEGGGGEAGEAVATAPPPSAETATAPADAGGEAGEAGAATAYAGLSGDQITALRLTHLKGFIMAAARVAGEDHSDEDDVVAAGALVAQGLLEVYDVAPDQFGALDVSVLHEADDGNGMTRAQMVTRLRQSEAAIDHAISRLHDVDSAITTVRMVDIATGLYQQVNQADFVDPIEYQHSMGAALAARAALQHGQNDLRRRSLRAYSEALGELNRFVELWPQAEAPATPSPYRDVLAQGSRVRLALSPYL